MDKYVVLKKADFPAFIKKIVEKNKVVAPIPKGYKNFAFAEINSSEEISLSYIPTIIPPKKYFMPQSETIQKFNKTEMKWQPVVESEKVVVFGVHTCDLAGIQFLNKVMATDPKDANYLARQAGVTTIGFECNVYCDEYASCALMKNHLPQGGYDLFMTDLNDIFLIHVATERGEELISQVGLCKPAGDHDKKKLAQLRAEKEKIFQPETKPGHDQLKDILGKTLESEVWLDLNRRCVSCGNCTSVCPTCYCFDVKDELNLDLNTGVRTRVWDGCQSENFAKVAGGENFREERGHRQRHRYLRKFHFPVKKFQMYSCTGCGRCSRTCMARINLKTTLNALSEDAR